MLDTPPEKSIEQKRLHPKFVVYASVLFLSGFLLGGVTLNALLARQLNTTKEVRLPEKYKFINPLLECIEEIGTYKYPNQLKLKVENYFSQEISAGNLTNAAVYYRDLNNGPWFGINERMLFTPASLIKVPMMITYYKKAESDPTLLAKKLKVVSDEYNLIAETYNDPKLKLIVGKDYTIEELINRMITYSDNTAYKVLKDDLTREEFNKTFMDFGIDIATIEKSTTENVLSILDYSSFFRILYNSSYLDRDFSEKALDLLSTTEFNEGLIAGLPKATVVSHKFGERFYSQSSEKQLHDCGIVYTKENPYLICVMTRGKDFAKLTDVLKNVSRIVNTFVESM